MLNPVSGRSLGGYMPENVKLSGRMFGLVIRPDTGTGTCLVSCIAVGIKKLNICAGFVRQKRQKKIPPFA
jgi:hypothetical protein